MARGHRPNTSIVLAAVHGLSGLFWAVSAVEPSLSRPLPLVPVPNKQPRFCGRKATWSRNADPSSTPSSALADLAHRPAKPVPVSGGQRSHHPARILQTSTQRLRLQLAREKKPVWAGEIISGRLFSLSSLPVKTAMGGIKANP